MKLLIASQTGTLVRNGWRRINTTPYQMFTIGFIIKETNKPMPSISPAMVVVNMLMIVPVRESAPIGSNGMYLSSADSTRLILHIKATRERKDKRSIMDSWQFSVGSEPANLQTGNCKLNTNAENTIILPGIISCK